jgi:hypothetical protein
MRQYRVCAHWKQVEKGYWGWNSPGLGERWHVSNYGVRVWRFQAILGPVGRNHQIIWSQTLHGFTRNAEATSIC